MEQIGDLHLRNFHEINVTTCSGLSWKLAAWDHIWFI